MHSDHMFRHLIAISQQLAAFTSAWFCKRNVSQQNVRRKVPEIARMLQNEDWLQLRGQCFFILRWLLSETVLRKGFQAISLTTGPIVHVGEPVIAAGWWLTSAKIPVEFQRAKLGLSIVLSPSGSLLSLRFLPLNLLGLGASWTPPRHALHYSFREIEVQVGAHGMRSPGTLTLPTSPGQHPCLIMLQGSGPCDQDSSVGCAKPFKDLALGLASRGVASLRFDKITHTYGAKLRNKNSFTLHEEYVSHARDALRQIFEHGWISPTGVYVLGHSLGAYVAPHLMVTDSRIAGCIIMAGPASSMCWSALRQYRYLASPDMTVDELPQIRDLDVSASSVPTRPSARLRRALSYLLVSERRTGALLQISTLLRRAVASNGLCSSRKVREITRLLLKMISRNGNRV